MQILVTGAAGFIGSATASALAKAGLRVLAVDNFSPYYSTDLKELRREVLLDSPQIEFRKVDLSDPETTNQLFEQEDFSSIIHLAAQAGVRVPIENWKKYTSDNLQGFSNLLISAANRGVKNFIYASSSSIYGNSTSNRFTESGLVPAPVSFYGATKLANEILASSTSLVTGMKTRGLRFFTVYGPWGRPDMVYFRMVASAITQEPFDFFGNGQVERDFTYISDVVAMIMELESELSSRGEGFSDVVNIGGGQPRSINQILHLIENIAKISIPFRRHEANRSDVQRTSADFTYLNSLINTYPTVRAEKGLEEFYVWANQPKVREKLPSWARSVK